MTLIQVGSPSDETSRVSMSKFEGFFFSLLKTVHVVEFEAQIPSVILRTKKLGQIQIYNVFVHTQQKYRMQE